MQFPILLTIALFAFGATAQFVGPNGQRFCAGGAISCEYQKGRCANVCADSSAEGGASPAFIDTVCSCPAGQADNLYTGAACIDVIRALERQGC